MILDRARALLPLAARDLVVAISGRVHFESVLDGLGRRRAALYANPQQAAASGEMYWVVLAAALAPIAPPEWMPMSGLVEQGVTLEGGAKGLRGLFVREPSEKERRRVQRIATLAARVMTLVAGTDLRPEEHRAIAMAMASFGLTPDELAQARPQSSTPSAEGLEIYVDLDARIRREVVRGAWQMAMLDKLEPAEERTIREIAARLEMSAQCDELRADVVERSARRGEMAAVAVEIARGSMCALPSAQTRPWLDHLIDSAAPWTRQLDLREAVASGAPPRLDALPRLDTARRRQALALAFATALGHDPGLSASLHLRAEIASAAITIGAGGELDEAYGAVERFFFDRVRDAASAAPDQKG